MPGSFLDLGAGVGVTGAAAVVFVVFPAVSPPPPRPLSRSPNRVPPPPDAAPLPPRPSLRGSDLFSPPPLLPTPPLPETPARSRCSFRPLLRSPPPPPRSPRVSFFSTVATDGPVVAFLFALPTFSHCGSSTCGSSHHSVILAWILASSPLNCFTSASRSLTLWGGQASRNCVGHSFFWCV